MPRLPLVFLVWTLLLSTLFAQVKGVSPQGLYKALSKHPKMIDVRKASAWDSTGIIPTAYRITFNQNDFKNWLSKFRRIIKSPKQPCVIISNTSIVSKFLATKLYSIGYKRVYFLRGGMNLWIKKKKPILKIANKI